MYLVFDVGGTFVKFAIMNKTGEIIKKNKIPTKNSKEDNLDTFVQSLVEIYRQVKDIYDIEGIAMGLPGQVDVENGIVYSGGALPFLHQARLGEIMSNNCDNIPCKLENDAKCAGLAEVWKGNARDCQDAALLIIGTGIGGAIIKDKHVHRGKYLIAGELSYVYNMTDRRDVDRIVNIDKMDFPEEDEDYKPISILSAFASAGSLTKRVAKEKKLNMDQVSGELIYKWAKEGDEICINALEDVYFYLAQECCRLYITMDPEIILIGGGISAEPEFIKGIQRYVTKLSKVSRVFDNINVTLCKFGSDSNLIGALCNYLQLMNML